jgi:hypothetical protein
VICHRHSKLRRYQTIGSISFQPKPVVTVKCPLFVLVHRDLASVRDDSATIQDDLAAVRNDLAGVREDLGGCSWIC